MIQNAKILIMEEHLITSFSSINEQAIKKKYNANITAAMLMFRRHLNAAMVIITNNNIKNNNITEQIIPDELTFT